jgi:starch synthase
MCTAAGKHTTTLHASRQLQWAVMPLQELLSAGEMYADIHKALDERTIGHNPERLNLLKGGMVYSNKVTTVSPTYAQEARSGGAAGFLRSVISEPKIGAKFSGILNGIDTTFWSPSTDPLIPAPFNAKSPAGKALCKRFLQRGLGLQEDESVPLVACITRLVPQKGIHLIRHSVHHCAGNNAQFVLLGSGHADGDFRSMAEHDFKDSDAVRCAHSCKLLIV